MYSRSLKLDALFASIGMFKGEKQMSNVEQN